MQAHLRLHLGRFAWVNEQIHPRVVGEFLQHIAEWPVLGVDAHALAELQLIAALFGCDDDLVSQNDICNLAFAEEVFQNVAQLFVIALKMEFGNETCCGPIGRKAGLPRGHEIAAKQTGASKHASDSGESSECAATDVTGLYHRH